MRQLVEVFTGICFRRYGPEDLPDSSFLLRLSVTLYALSSIVYSAIGPGSSATGILGLPVYLSKGLLDTAFAVLWFSILLMVSNRSQRINQTLTAVLGVGVLLTLFAMPIAVGFVSVPEQSPALALLFLGLLLLTGWQVTVIGHIVHRALGMPLAGGLVVAIAYAVSYYALIRFLYPVQTGGSG